MRSIGDEDGKVDVLEPRSREVQDEPHGFGADA